AAGAALIRLRGPAGGWPTFAGAVLLAAAGMAAVYFFVVGGVRLVGGVGIDRHWRAAPREDVLDELLAILADLAEPHLRNDLDNRAYWLSGLERAASTVEKRLPEKLKLADKATTAWAAERARGAATALRLLKRQIAAPVDGTWDRLIAVLRQQTVAVATGDLGKLRWAAPPSAASVRRSRRTTAIAVLRTAVVTVAPLVTVFAVQPLLGLDAGVLRWAKVAGLGWGVLYLLLTADPTLREKV